MKNNTVGGFEIDWMKLYMIFLHWYSVTLVLALIFLAHDRVFFIY